MPATNSIRNASGAEFHASSLIEVLITLALATGALAGLLGSSSAAQIAQPDPEYTGTDRVEEWQGKTVLAITPHPDDETFTSGGTLAILARSNDVHVLIYTSDNAGSRDPTMTHERLASIRKSEEEEACRALGAERDALPFLQLVLRVGRIAVPTSDSADLTLDRAGVAVRHSVFTPSSFCCRVLRRAPNGAYPAAYAQRFLGGWLKA